MIGCLITKKKKGTRRINANLEAGGTPRRIRKSNLKNERDELSTFTGDVLDWVKKRIESASLVVADLSDTNPNVYLEVGYAWRCGRPTVLLVRDTAHLKFDVKGQRCLSYKKIKDLESSLRKELEVLKRTVLNEASKQAD